MKNIAVKVTVMFILLTMMLYDVGGKPEGFDVEARDYLVGFVVAFYIACYFFLRYFFRVQEGKQWLKSHTTLKSIVASICLILLVRAAVFGGVGLFCGDIYGLFANKDKTVQAQATGESFDPDTKTYFNHTYQFSFKMPEGWQRRSAKSGNDEIFAANSEEKLCNVSICVDEKQLDKPDTPVSEAIGDMEEYIRTTRGEAEAEGGKVKESTYKKTEVSGREVIRLDLIIEFNVKGEYIGSHIIDYITTKGRHLLHIRLMSLQVVYEAETNYYDNLFKSFAFTD